MSCTTRPCLSDGHYADVSKIMFGCYGCNMYREHLFKATVGELLLDPFYQQAMREAEEYSRYNESHASMDAVQKAIRRAEI